MPPPPPPAVVATPPPPCPLISLGPGPGSDEMLPQFLRGLEAVLVDGLQAGCSFWGWRRPRRGLASRDMTRRWMGDACRLVETRRFAHFVLRDMAGCGLVMLWFGLTSDFWRVFGETPGCEWEEWENGMLVFVATTDFVEHTQKTMADKLCRKEFANPNAKEQVSQWPLLYGVGWVQYAPKKTTKSFRKNVL